MFPLHEEELFRCSISNSLHYKQLLENIEQILFLTFLNIDLNSVILTFMIIEADTFCVVFFSSSCVPYVASFYGLSNFDCPFGIL